MNGCAVNFAAFLVLLAAKKEIEKIEQIRLTKLDEHLHLHLHSPFKFIFVHFLLVQLTKMGNQLACLKMFLSQKTLQYFGSMLHLSIKSIFD
jgi:hypothetical protein